MTDIYLVLGGLIVFTLMVDTLLERIGPRTGKCPKCGRPLLKLSDRRF
jgi:hypothetical protein